MSHGFITRRMRGYCAGGDPDDVLRVWPRQGKKTLKMASGTGLEQTPELTGVERLCYDLIAEAIVSYVQGDPTAAWWLFDEGVDEGPATSAISFVDACDLLEWSAERFREKIRTKVAVLGAGAGAPKSVLRDLAQGYN